ncbi:hypothetical protein HK100_004824 [Physocladia obscura]|uniref:SAM domain-containing protein n=1 Tax=Physocladia obscura TaxID=109957 RepID=A0AAD5XCB0_9FUNG|nr:hypothetical protein HK100_004824 [Physocladia obscura]
MSLIEYYADSACTVPVSLQYTPGACTTSSCAVSVFGGYSQTICAPTSGSFKTTASTFFNGALYADQTDYATNNCTGSASGYEADLVNACVPNSPGSYMYTNTEYYEWESSVVCQGSADLMIANSRDCQLFVGGGSFQLVNYYVGTTASPVVDPTVSVSVSIAVTASSSNGSSSRNMPGYTAGSASSSTSSSPSNNTGAIVGGVIGGVVALFLIAATIWFIRRKKQASLIEKGVLPPHETAESTADQQQKLQQQRSQSLLSFLTSKNTKQQSPPIAAYQAQVQLQDQQAVVSATGYDNNSNNNNNNSSSSNSLPSSQLQAKAAVVSTEAAALPPKINLFENISAVAVGSFVGKEGGSLGVGDAKENYASVSVNGGGALASNATSPIFWSVDDTALWILQSGGSFDSANRVRERGINGKALLAFNVEALLALLEVSDASERQRLETKKRHRNIFEHSQMSVVRYYSDSQCTTPTAIAFTTNTCRNTTCALGSTGAYEVKGCAGSLTADVQTTSLAYFSGLEFAELTVYGSTSNCTGTSTGFTAALVGACIADAPGGSFMFGTSEISRWSVSASCAGTANTVEGVAHQQCLAVANGSSVSLLNYIGTVSLPASVSPSRSTATSATPTASTETAATVSSVVPSPTLMPTATSSRLVGGVVGGVGALTVAVAVAFVCCRRRRRLKLQVLASQETPVPAVTPIPKLSLSFYRKQQHQTITNKESFELGSAAPSPSCSSSTPTNLTARTPTATTATHSYPRDRQHRNTATTNPSNLHLASSPTNITPTAINADPLPAKFDLFASINDGLDNPNHSSLSPEKHPLATSTSDYDSPSSLPPILWSSENIAHWLLSVGVSPDSANKIRDLKINAKTFLALNVEALLAILEVSNTAERQLLAAAFTALVVGQEQLAPPQYF